MHDFATYFSLVGVEYAGTSRKPVAEKSIQEVVQGDDWKKPWKHCIRFRFDNEKSCHFPGELCIMAAVADVSHGLEGWEPNLSQNVNIEDNYMSEDPKIRLRFFFGVQGYSRFPLTCSVTLVAIKCHSKKGRSFRVDLIRRQLAGVPGREIRVDSQVGSHDVWNNSTRLGCHRVGILSDPGVGQA